MDLTGIARNASIAETGSRQEDAAMEVLKRAQQIESSTATQLIDAIKSTPTVQNLPEHLGKNVNTTA